MQKIYEIGTKALTENNEFIVIVGYHPTIEDLYVVEGNGCRLFYLKESRIISLR